MPSSSTVFARSTRFLSIRWVMSGLPFDVGRWCARPCDGQLTPAKRSVGLLKCDACRRHTSCLLPAPGLRHVPLQRQYSSLADFAAVRSASQLGQNPVVLWSSTGFPLRPQNPTSAMPTDAALIILLNAERRQDGSLLTRAPPAVPGRGCS